MKLYGFWRSAASFRVRVALNIKGIERDEVSIDMFGAEQCTPAYKALNPQGLLPTLIDGNEQPLVQSMAIMEYLEEVQPDPPLLPRAPGERARVRALSQIIASDSHPLITPRVRLRLAEQFGADEAQRLAWLQHWLAQGLISLEAHLARSPDATGRFCHGDTVTMADICLASQAIVAEYFKIELRPYPTIRRIVRECEGLEPFVRAHPASQPGGSLPTQPDRC